MEVKQNLFVNLNFYSLKLLKKICLETGKLKCSMLYIKMLTKHQNLRKN